MPCSSAACQQAHLPPQLSLVAAHGPLAVLLWLLTPSTILTVVYELG